MKSYRHVATGAFPLVAILQFVVASVAVGQAGPLPAATAGRPSNEVSGKSARLRTGPDSATGARAQAISLAEAHSRAQSQSEAVGIARIAAARATGEQLRARSRNLPQVFASAGYVRTLKSQFEDFTSGGSTLEGFEKLPFGQENQWSLGLQLSQAVYSGGRIAATNDIARSATRSAEIELAAQLAQLTVDVTVAYYDAALADRLVEIADSSLAQTESALNQMELLRQAGDRSEFELLRARVTRDNQRPASIQRRAERDVAYFRLKQLIGYSYETPLQLATAIQEENLETGILPPGMDTTSATRSAVRQAAEAVSVNESLLSVQRSERLPVVGFTSEYGRVGYPATILPRWGGFLDNWTLGIAMQLPVFTGGRLRGAELVARANVDESRLQMRQASELAALDARSTLASLREAEEAWRASLGTVEQAQRAHEIAEVRFREGLSTQLELTESRVLLQSAQAHRAVAARNLHVIQVRLSVLSDLPLGAAPPR